MAPGRTTAARTSARPRPSAGAASRLDLLEALLLARDPEQCSQRALAWLQRQCGVRRALCLAADAARVRLVPVASLGLPSQRLDRFSVDLDVRDHTLTQALLSSAPVLLSMNGHASAVTPLGQVHVMTLSLAPPTPSHRPARILI